MIHYIKGILTCKLAAGVVIENAGIGYEISVPGNSRLYLLEDGSDVAVYTYMNVREDDISLFGFDEEEGLNLFKQLITVNGIGAKAAMSILSAMPTADVKKSIILEDINMLSTAQGIGKKTAQRIVLELKDKFKDSFFGSDGEESKAEASKEVSFASTKNEARDALIALGYSATEAQAVISEIKQDDLSVEEYIKIALRNI